MTRTAGFLGTIVAATLLSTGISTAQQQVGMDRLDRLFEQIDLDASGTLTVVEMRSAAAARFNALDLDGNGTVSQRERDESGGNRLAIGFKRADTDHNGTLDIHEMQAVAKQRAHRRLGRLDTNGDGVLSLEEMQQGQSQFRSAVQTGTQAMTLPQLDARMMDLFRRADADGDGIVTLREAMDGAGR